MFEIEGIDKVESNFEEEKSFDIEEGVVIKVFYNPNLLSIEDMKQIDLNLTI